jgi:hypothetical protein
MLNASNAPNTRDNALETVSQMHQVSGYGNGLGPRGFLTSSFRRPVVLVGLTALLAVLLVQSGELGDIDTSRRLQTTHSFWTSSPPVKEGEYPNFGVVGRNGQVYAPYGIGQSLLMLPADIIGTYISRLPSVRERFSESTTRQLVVSYITSLMVCTTAILVCFRLLMLLSFNVNQAIVGSLSLLFGTTFLHYSQNMQENNFILLLTLTGFSFLCDWLQTGHIRSLLFGSLALGANLLTRLTTAMDIMAATLFVFLFLWFRNIRGRSLVRWLGRYAVIALPCYAVFIFIDRLYQFYRFGGIFKTYMAVWTEQQRSLHPVLPANFPWNAPLKVGVFGPLFTAHKSIFLFDPLIVVTLLVAALAWKRLGPSIRAWIISALCLLATYILFHATYYGWWGGWGWGDRYTTTPVQLLGMTSIPLLLRYRSELSNVVRNLCIAIAISSVLIQLSSIIFWFGLEIEQMKTPGHSNFVIGLRFQNILALALGDQMAPVNLFPFVLWYAGRKRAATIVGGCSILLIAAMGYLLYLIWKRARNGDFALQPIAKPCCAGQLGS